jgi:hypothetical protein
VKENLFTKDKKRRFKLQDFIKRFKIILALIFNRYKEGDDGDWVLLDPHEKDTLVIVDISNLKKKGNR